MILPIYILHIQLLFFSSFLISFLPNKNPEVSETEGIAVPDSVEQKRLDAQATLKGTVGGVQGILEIQKSVAEGITDRDAAIALLIEIYGFTEEQAINVVGTPKIIDINAQSRGTNPTTT